jgi:hypothetical protein
MLSVCFKKCEALIFILLAEKIERFERLLADKPTLIIASEGDGGNYTSAQKLFAAANNGNSRFISYKGEDHGYPLLDRDKHLATSIVSWFDSQLH